MVWSLEHKHYCYTVLERKYLKNNHLSDVSVVIGMRLHDNLMDKYSYTANI